MPSLWTRIWNERDVQIMVLFSLALHLILLLAGNVRRQRRVGWLRFLVWLFYLATYAVATSAIGLFSRYEDKYKLRSLESFEHLHMLTLPFLWPPFLLLHFGGPDTITAFSIDDNNLWTRQLLNLVFQLSLALYVFWKSFDLLDVQLLKVAVPLFVAGIIKYGERIRALQKGSREKLDYSHVVVIIPWPSHPPGDFMASRALNSALIARRLLVGRAIEQLRLPDMSDLLGAIGDTQQTEKKVEFVLTELGMIYDMLYTKTAVLQCLPGAVFRFVVLILMVVAFVLFWVNQNLHAHKTVNADITYTLFIATIFMEVYSILLVIASPWTRARTRVFYWLSCKLAYCFPSQRLSSPSMGQFNLTDYSLAKKSMPHFIYLVIETLGLENQWRNIWHVSYVEDMEIVNYIVGLLSPYSNQPGERSRKLELGYELNYLLTKSFEHVLFRLHIFTEMHLGTLDGSGSSEMSVLVAECRKLSNYLMYLMVVYPSMMPVSGASQDLEFMFSDWVRRNHGNFTKTRILKKYANEMIGTDSQCRSPFKEPPSVETLKDMKELWARLLIYAAGKCPMELHARQLGNGVELIAVVGLLMMHLNLGDVAKKVELLAHEPSQENCVFKFLQDEHQVPAAVQPLSLLLGERARVVLQPSTSSGTDEAVPEIEDAGVHQ